LSVAPAEERAAPAASASSARLPHLPALDGLRGLAVVAVVAFHLDLLRGGWLGVDVFFVLSGFLITRLLVTEQAATGRVSLGNFWRRRARRLVPALVVVLVGVAGYAWWYPEPELLPADLPQQFVATVAYVANWFQISASNGYWDQYSVASPLEHMWSLAIEEQFYVLFPLLMLGLFTVGLRRMRVAMALAGLTLASWSWAVWRLADGASFERVYLGTDTRIGAILCGAAVGALTCDEATRDRLVTGTRPLVLPALVGVGAALILIDGSSGWSGTRWLLLPGFELLVCVLLVATLAPKDRSLPGAPNRFLSLRANTWLGGISYGLYLWHIPVILAVERALRDQPRALEVVVAVVVSVALAQASVVVVERPIRRDGLAVAPRFVLGTVAVVALVASFGVVRSATHDARALDAQRLDPGPQVSIAAVEGGSAPALEGQATLPLEPPAGRAPRILLLGDSMAADLGPGLVDQADVLGYSASQASMVGCGDGGMDVERDLPNAFNDATYVAECDAWRATFGDLVAEAQPDVVLVVRASARRTIPGSDVVWNRCQPRYLRWYRASMAAEIEVLGSAGSAVALAQRPYNRFGDVVDPENDAEVDCLNKALADVADADPNAVLVPLNDWLCPARDACVSELDGVTLRPDGLHFRDDGAVAAARWIHGQLYDT